MYVLVVTSSKNTVMFLYLLDEFDICETYRLTSAGYFFMSLASPSIMYPFGGIVFPFGPLRGKSMSTGRFRRIISARNKRSDHLIIIISSQLPTSWQAVNDS